MPPLPALPPPPYGEGRAHAHEALHALPLHVPAPPLHVPALAKGAGQPLASVHVGSGELLRVHEVAAVLRHARPSSPPAAAYVRRLHEREGLPFVKVGRQRLTRRADLDAWLDARVAGPASSSFSR